MRIILVDSSEIFRMGMRAALAQAATDVVIAAEAVSVATALDAVRTHAPELVITDLELPDGDAIALATGIRELGLSTRVLVLASTATEANVRRAIVAGVDGYVLKSQPPREIGAALRDVAAGRRVEPPAGTHEVSHDAAADTTRGTRAAVLERLSTREHEIFELIIWGQTNKQVAAKLGISVKTVETHRSHINGKLQVHSAAELVRLASLCGALDARGDGPTEAAGLSATIATAALGRSSRDRLPGKVPLGRPPLPQLVAKSG